MAISFGKGNLRATITGILADPAATSEMAKAISAAMQPEVARVAGLIRAATPVTDEPPRPKGGNPPPGSLRKAVDVYGVVSSNGAGFVLMARADAAMRAPTAGDSKRSAARIASFHKSEDRRLQRALQKGKEFKPRTLSAKKGGRRYGPVPYGIFVDNETGFLTDTMTDEYPTIIAALNDAILGHVRDVNAGSGDSPRA